MLTPEPGTIEKLSQSIKELPDKEEYENALVVIVRLIITEIKIIKKVVRQLLFIFFLLTLEIFDKWFFYLTFK